MSAPDAKTAALNYHRLRRSRAMILTMVLSVVGAFTVSILAAYLSFLWIELVFIFVPPVMMHKLTTWHQGASIKRHLLDGGELASIADVLFIILFCMAVTYGVYSGAVYLFTAAIPT